MRRTHLLVLANVLVLLLPGCAGLGNPISSRYYEEIGCPDGSPSSDDEGSNRDNGGENKASKLECLYRHPRKTAVARIVQWDNSIANLQRANSGANVALPGLATILGYRAARDLGKAATVGWAGVGIMGMSLTESFVQVSRINIYSAGIGAMECTLAAVDVDDDTDEPKALKSLADALKAGAPADAWATYTSLNRQYGISKGRLDSALADKVSEITRRVDELLMGSIVSANARRSSWGSAFIFPDSSIPVDQQINRLGSTDKGEPSAAVQLAMANAKSFVGAYTTLLPERIEALSKCGVGEVSPAQAELSDPLTVNLLGASEPLQVGQGKTEVVQLSGGKPPYMSHLVSPPEKAPPTAKIVGGILELTAAEETAVGEYTVVVSDQANGSRKLIFKVIEPK